MCTKEQVKEAVLEVLYDYDEDGESIVGKEVNAHITNKGNQIVAKLTFRFGIALLMTLLTALGIWYSLYYQVQQNTKSINDNQIAINEGGRFTQEEADQRQAEYQRQILEIKQTQVEATAQVRSDIKELRSIILSR